MKQRFVSKNFRDVSLALIAKCNEIIEGYQEQGYRLTLRQLYYQLVSRNIVPNTEKSYKNVGSVLSDARLAGLVDWSAIEDRVRVPKTPTEFDDLDDLVDAALASYRLPRLDPQETYVELWVEKDALAGVLSPIGSQYHVVLMVNRGYSSQSAMYEAAARFARRGKGKKKVLLYLGDHDPSGEDMVRDIGDRLTMFGVRVSVRKLALTMAQVEEYDPPPNPAKMSDSRAEKYVAEYGDSSWEVDALPPEVLTKIITDALDEILDPDVTAEVLKREESDKARLREALESLSD